MGVNEGYDTEGRRESHLLPGLRLYRYTREVEYIDFGKKTTVRQQLTPNQFSVFDLLHDRNGKIPIGELKNLCWLCTPTDETIKSTICTLNVCLASIHVPITVTKAGGIIIFSEFSV